MVNYEKLLVSPVKLCMEQPKALLPAVLATIPSFLWLALFASFIKQIAAVMNRDALDCRLNAFFAPFFTNATNAGTKTACPSVIGIPKLTGILISYAPYALGILVVSIIITMIANLAYASLVFQKRRADAGAQEGGILVSEAFRSASANLFRLLWTGVVFCALWTLVFAAYILVMGALWFIPVIGIILDALLGLSLLAVLAVGPYLSGLVLTPVVFMEDVSGWNAVKRSVSILRANAVPFIVLMLLSFALYGAVSKASSLVQSFIPIVGFIITYIITLFLTAWGSMAPVELYFETIGTGKYRKRA